MDELDLRIDGVAVGGDGVGRDADGRVVFVAGALPGERARVRVTEERRRFARAELVAVTEPSPDRVEPRCPHVAAGCGGCGFAHVAPDAQRRLKVDAVRQALQRLGGLADPPVSPGPELAVWAARTTVRAGVVGGRAGFRMARSHDVLAVDSCAVTHPLVAELLVEGRFGDAREVVLRAGARTGERSALVSPSAEGVALPDDVLVVGADELRSGRRAWIHEELAGRRWRVSVGSFLQARPDGAEALVDLVADALAGAPDGPLVDLYAGIGLFAGTVGAGRRVVAVERDRDAVADARVNVPDAKVIRAAVARWRPSPAAAVVADPARSGLGAAGADAVAAAGASHVALVSCDAGALGRDAALLADRGYRLERATLVDLFPHTPHVEVVSRFVRA